MIRFLVIFFIFTGVNTFAQNNYEVKKVIIEKRYYENGELEYISKTIRKGIDKSTGRIYGKQIIKLKEYYKNGQKELKEKKILPRIVEQQHLIEDRHVLLQKKNYRKYTIWNKDGKIIEKGKYTFRGKKRIVKYNFQGYKKVIITYDKEVGRDVFKKKKPIYK